MHSFDVPDDAPQAPSLAAILATLLAVAALVMIVLPAIGLRERLGRLLGRVAALGADRADELGRASPRTSTLA